MNRQAHRRRFYATRCDKPRSDQRQAITSAQMSHTSLTSTVNVVKNTRHHPRHHTRIRGEVKVFHHTDGRTKTCVGKELPTNATRPAHEKSAGGGRRGLNMKALIKHRAFEIPGKQALIAKTVTKVTHIYRTSGVYILQIAARDPSPPPFSCMKNDTERINPYLCRRRSVDTTDPQPRR